MNIGDYLQLPFAQHALEAAFLVAISCGLIGPFVITRTMSFAVHGTSELAFTGAVAGLLVAENALAGALVGALVVATLIGVLGQRASERDSTIGVIAVAVALALVLMWRPLLFASVDPDVAGARGVRTGLLGIVFLFVLAITVTEAAQIVGTLLVLSLAITPAAAAQRLSASPVVVTVLSVVMAVVAADGGLLLSFQFPTVKPSVLIVAVSFAFYVAARVVGPALGRRRRERRERREPRGRVTELAELQHG